VTWVFFILGNLHVVAEKTRVTSVKLSRFVQRKGLCDSSWISWTALPMTAAPTPMKGNLTTVETVASSAGSVIRQRNTSAAQHHGTHHQRDQPTLGGPDPESVVTKNEGKS